MRKTTVPQRLVCNIVEAIIPLDILDLPLDCRMPPSLISTLIILHSLFPVANLFAVATVRSFVCRLTGILAGVPEWRVVAALCRSVEHGRTACTDGGRLEGLARKSTRSLDATPSSLPFFA